MVTRRGFGGALLGLLMLASAGLAGVGLLGCLQTRGTEVPSGQAAPDFTLTSHQGKQVKLSELTRTGPVVLVFYRGFW